MDTQQQYRGQKSKLPTLLAGQLGYCTDTTELYIGAAAGNVLVGSGKFAQAIADLQTYKLSASQAEAVALLADTADLAAVITGLNSMINSLKTAGIMKS